MIPKIIHYCWFGGNPLPELAEKCIESWKKFCPNYEIKRWDESNFDVFQNQYCKEAYDAKKWAFVSDYARLKILYDFGGIYMDTDVEVVKSLDNFLDCKAFSGFESNKSVPTGIMASEKGGKWIEYLLGYYDDRSFILPDGNLDMTTNIVIITKMMCERYPLKLDNTYQYFKGEVVLFPNEFFCPKNFETGKVYATDNTCTIHHFNGSWISDDWCWRSPYIQKYQKFMGRTMARYVSLILYCVKTGKIKEVIRKLIKKMRK